MAGFTGMDALIRGMKALPERLKAEAKQTIDNVADQAVGDIQANYGSDRMARGVRKRKAGDIGVKVSSTDPKAHWFEFGTVKRMQYTRKGKNVGKIAPLPTNRNFVSAVIRARKRQYREHEDTLRKAKVPGMDGSAI
jgi:hypothetical protein